MIYLFHGTDVAKVRSKAFAWIAAAREKEANLAYLRLAREELTPAAIEEFTVSGGLFVKRLLVLLDDPFPQSRAAQSEESDEEGLGAVGIQGDIKALAASDNAIVILAPKLPAAKAKELAVYAKKTYVFDLAKARTPARAFNSALINALSTRNRAALWLEINRAFRAGDAPEMVHGLLHWKARDLMAKGSRSWSFAEARKLSMDLIDVLQAARRSGLPLDKGLERFSLTV